MAYIRLLPDRQRGLGVGIPVSGGVWADKLAQMVLVSPSTCCSVGVSGSMMFGRVVMFCSIIGGSRSGCSPEWISCLLFHRNSLPSTLTR